MAHATPSTSTSGRPFAVFDIDGTLIRWQMFHAIVHHLGKEGYILRTTHDEIRAARMEWKRRTTHEGFKAYERVLLDAYIGALTSIDPAAYQQIVDDVYAEYKDQVFVYTRDLIKDLKHKDYVLFAISGSQQDIIAKLAAHHGFDAARGATLIQHNGAFTGEIDTPVHDKASVLEELIAQYGVRREGSVGVGDSMSDVPMLAAVERPIVFNPDRTLYQEATKRHWQIVVERKNMVYTMHYHDTGYILA